MARGAASTRELNPIWSQTLGVGNLRRRAGGGRSCLREKRKKEKRHRSAKFIRYMACRERGPDGGKLETNGKKEAGQSRQSERGTSKTFGRWRTPIKRLVTKDGVTLDNKRDQERFPSRGKAGSARRSRSYYAWVGGHIHWGQVEKPR